MKEFQSNTGGRYTFSDDLLNLQELALAFSSIFDGCGNFIVSGCTVSGDTISEGIVYLNGKLRKFSGASGITSWPQYIYEKNKTEDVQYESGGRKIGRNVWSCTSGSSVPTSDEPLTGKAPQSITINSAGGITIKDAFFARYCVVKQPDGSISQSVSGGLSASYITAQSDIRAGGRVTIQSSANQGSVYCEDGKLILKSAPTATDDSYTIALSDSDSITVSKNGSAIATFSDSGVTFTSQLRIPKALIGNLAVAGNGIYVPESTDEYATVDINMIGYNNGTEHFRQFRVGDGKGNKILSVQGNNRTSYFDGIVYITNEDKHGLVMRTTKTKDADSFLNTISYCDVNYDQLGFIGYPTYDSHTMYLMNNLSNVIISGQGYVNIRPVIRENNVALADKYTLKSVFESEMAKKANVDGVYSKDQADARFAILSKGFQPFISAGCTRAELRTALDVPSNEDMSHCPKNENYLSDMVGNNEELKRQVRNNIGAASAAEVQGKLTDTGWVSIDGNTLMARQIGNIVCIQGVVVTKYSGTQFVLPDSIQPPKLSVGYSAPMKGGGVWGCVIETADRKCEVVYCNQAGKGVSIPISITYMIK